MKEENSLSMATKFTYLLTEAEHYNPEEIDDTVFSKTLLIEGIIQNLIFNFQVTINRDEGELQAIYGNW